MKKITESIFSIVLLFFVVSCNTVKTADYHRESSEEKVLHRLRDSIYVRDSIMIKVKADTVYKTRLQTVFRDRWLTDTLILHDTLRVAQQRSDDVAGEKVAHSVGLSWSKIAVFLIVVAVLYKCSLPAVFKRLFKVLCKK